MGKYRILSDIFAVPGLLCLFFGALRWMAGQGAYRGLSYVVKNALCLLTFRERKPYAPKGIKKNGNAALLIAGAILITVSSIFAGLYYK